MTADDSFERIPGLPSRSVEALNRSLLAPAGTPTVDGNILNVRPDPVDFRDRTFEPGLIALKSWFEPEPLSAIGLTVRDQGQEGSCTGQALAALVDIQNLPRFREKADVPNRVSARMMYECARLHDEYPDDSLPGSSARGAIKGFFDHGVCDEALAPYRSGETGWKLTPQHVKDARRVMLGAYFRLRHILNDYHAALMEAGAIYCTAMIHDGWAGNRVAGNYGKIPLPGGPLSANLIGGHAFCIVGYDPTGFLVLNSWGPDWGKFKRHSDGTALPGVAHWSYDDWSAHVMDAWVLRLGVPTKKASGFAGGFTRARQDESAAPTERVRANEIVGHYIHVDNGKFFRGNSFANDAGTFVETAKKLKEDETRSGGAKYSHLLFFAHGGLNSLGDAAARALAMKDGFLRNGIYPLMYLWRTGFKEAAGDLLSLRSQAASERAGGFFSDSFDFLLEKAIGWPGEALWKEMKNDAERAFLKSADAEMGAAWTATRILLEGAATRTSKPLRIHFVGHSAGAIFLGRLFERAKKENYDLSSLVASVTLFAPATTWEYFSKHIAPFARANPDTDFAIYNLTDKGERDDESMPVYTKSLLYLVSNAFEKERGTPLTGMDRFWSDHRKPGNIDYYLAGKSYGGQVVSRSVSHGGFDNDAVTMNHALNRILGKAADYENPLAFRPEELRSNEF